MEQVGHTEEGQALERKRLFDLIERLVVWENAGDEALLREAHAEIAAPRRPSADEDALDHTVGRPP